VALSLQVEAYNFPDEAKQIEHALPSVCPKRGSRRKGGA
jgi:hypothetical protein